MGLDGSEVFLPRHRVEEAILQLGEFGPQLFGVGRDFDEMLLRRMAEEANLPPIGIDPRAEDALMDYHWPGNVRELSNILERALSSLEGNTIGMDDLPFHLFHKGNLAHSPRSAKLKKILDAAEKEAIANALKQSGGNKARAARILGIHRTLLYKKMHKHRG